MRFIYRQKGDGLVEIFMLGSIDVSGWLIKPMAALVVEDVTFGMTRILDCSETKRLTQMACEFQKRKHDERRGRKPARQPSVGDDTACSVCQRERKSGFGGVKLVPCLVCGHVACSRCRTNKQIFVTSNDGLLGKLLKVPVCSVCIMAANMSYYEQQYRAQQKSSSGEEMSFRPMHLSDRYEREDSLSFSESSSRGPSRLQREEGTGSSSDLRRYFNAVRDRDNSAEPGRPLGQR